MMRWLCLLLAVACATSPPGAVSETDPHADHAHGTVWTCSMHPQVREDGPGTCPLCGMALEEVAVASAPGDVSVQVEGRIVQSTGIRTRRVARTTLYRHLRSLGEVVAPEDEVHVVSTRTSGWITDLRADTTGSEVRRGAVLFTLYAPELVEAQQELLRSAGGSPRHAAATARLARLGMATADVARVVDRGEAQDDVPIRAVRSGTVLGLGVAEGARVTPGTQVLELADLSRVWIEAEVYGPDAPWVEEGLPATITVRDDPGATRDGTVSFVHPTMDARQRTLTVRIEVDNADGSLRPGQLTTVQLGFRARPDVLALPREAILHSGRREVVFVHEGEGRFRPREIRTGLSGDRNLVEVLEGLHEGEEIVTSGQFLLDAETQLQEAFQGLAPAQQGAPDPDAYACPMHPEQVSDAPGRCGVCGMDLEPVVRDDVP